MVDLLYCAIEWTDYGTRVVFADGAEASAWPHYEDPHYHVVSHRCGYGDDLLWYCREHELAHAVIGEVLLDGPSYVLNCLAHQRDVNYAAAVFEETAVQTLQRWVRANEQPIVGDCDWWKLRERFLVYASKLVAPCG